MDGEEQRVAELVDVDLAPHLLTGWGIDADAVAASNAPAATEILTASSRA